MLYGSEALPGDTSSDTIIGWTRELLPEAAGLELCAAGRGEEVLELGQLGHPPAYLLVDDVRASCQFNLDALVRPPAYPLSFYLGHGFGMAFNLGDDANGLRNDKPGVDAGAVQPFVEFFELARLEVELVDVAVVEGELNPRAFKGGYVHRCG